MTGTKASPARRRSRALSATVLGGALLLGSAGLAAAATMESTGPLTSIYISEDLNCDVRYLGDSEPEFYGGTACGTFAAASGTLYGPADIPAGGSAWPRTGWTPVSQDNGGSGTSADPQWVNTVVSGGALSLTQVDTYVNGQNSYRSSITVTNTSNEAVETVVYRAADCYLQDSDYGFGEHNPATGSVICRAPDQNHEQSNAGRIEEFVPLTSGSSFLYDGYDEVWAAVGSQLPFPNEVRNGSESIDNGMGLSWTLTLAPGASQSVSLLTNFSPLGITALPSSLAVSPAEVAVGSTSTVTAGIRNPNITDQTLSSVTVTLPGQARYVAGSASGIVEPTVSGDYRTLTFAGPIAVDSEDLFNFSFTVMGSASGSGSLILSAETVSGAPVSDASARLTVTGDGPELQVVTPGPVLVTQASCTASGAATVPTVELPANTEAVKYSIDGEVEAGNTVQVVALAQDGYVFPASIEGWAVSNGNATATKTIVLDEANCEVPAAVIVAPEDPKIVQATCDADPKVTLPKTEGLVYSGVPANLKADSKFTLTATASEGFKVGPATGWTVNSEGTQATKEFTLAKAPADCKPGKGGLAETGANSWTPTILGASVLLTVAGAAAMTITRRRANQ